MAWWGYKIYGGDDPLECVYDIVKWAGIKTKNHNESEHYDEKKDVLMLYDHFKEKLKTNLSKVLKKMPDNDKIYFTEHSALYWHILSKLIIDNGIKIKDIVIKNKIYEKAIYATIYLMGDHAEQFKFPKLRRKILQDFKEKIINIL